jgi:hypothetical protein
VVVPGPDLGARPDGESAAAMGVGCPILGDRHMILHLTLKTAALVGETPAEWELLEKQVRAGRWTTGPPADESRLRALAAELGVTVREKGVVLWKRKRPRRPHTNSMVQE